MSSQSETVLPPTRAVADLRIRLLGPPHVEWAGHPLSIPRRQARALLYRLAARLEPVPREQLTFFWLDTPESTARRNLSHLLTHVRRALPDPNLLLTSDDRVALDSQRTWSDTDAFEHLCATWEPDRRIEFLRQAVSLYRGPFLAGFSLPASPEFEAWATQEQQAFERLYLEALAALVEERTAQGAYDDAIAYARRYLETDDLAEEVHRRLIQLYAAAGDRSAALGQYERCVSMLERELGVSPLPETRAAYQAVLQGRSPLLQRPVPWLAWTTLPGLDVPLVGREEALHILERAYARARMGSGRVTLISGEAGIGKSRLMQDFATRLGGQTLVLTGAAQPGAHALPYHPITQALRSVLNVSHFAFDLQPIWLAEVSRLLPELRTLYPDVPSPISTEPGQARARLFEALCRLTLALAAGQQPVLLCLDDLHRADDATLDWLAYLGHRLQDSRLLVLGTYRAGETDTVAELRRNLSRLSVLSELKLEGLGQDAILQLLRHLTLTPPAPLSAPRSPQLWGGRGAERERGGQGGVGEVALAVRLQQATGGIPFFLLETLRALIEAGRLPGDPADLEEFPLPDSVREAVEARLQRLSPTARQVLEAGAVLGATFGFDLVRLTAGRRELETMDSLDELVARQLLVQHDTGYRFQHDLARRVVEVCLSPVRRQLLHRRAGRALEHVDRHAVVALAHHFEAGGEAKKALHYHGLAARQAEALFAWREAEEHLGWMLKLLDQMDPDRSQPDCLVQRGQILADRAHLRFLQGRLAERDADLTALTVLAEISGDAGLLLQALAHQARYLNLDGHYPEAIEAARQGLALADSLDDASARCRFLAQIGFAHYFLGQPQPALEALESALAVAGSEATPETRGRITHILGYVHLHLGNYAQALTRQQEAYACHQAVGDHNRMAWDLTDMGIVYTRLNRLTEAEEHLVKALELARKIGSQPAESYALNNLGTLHYLRSNYPAALRCHEESLVLQRATGSRRGEASALANLGIVHLALGDYAAAESLLHQAIAIQGEIGYESGLAEALAYLAQVLAGLGRSDEALDAARRSLSLAREIGDPYNQIMALNVLAQLQRAAGETEQALSLTDEAVRVAQETDLAVSEMLGEIEAGL